MSFQKFLKKRIKNSYAWHLYKIIYNIYNKQKVKPQFYTKMKTRTVIMAIVAFLIVVLTSCSNKEPSVKQEYDYIWSTEDTTATIDVTEPGEYWVDVTENWHGVTVFSKVILPNECSHSKSLSQVLWECLFFTNFICWIAVIF